MSQLKEIKSRKQSVRNTKQITRAMKMISAVKLRKAQERILNLRSYANGIVSVITDVVLSQRVEHPLLHTYKSEKKRPLLVVLSSDRGLCGSFNYNVCRKAENYLKENKNYDVYLIGQKAVDYFKFRGISSIEKLTGLDREISFPLAAKVSQFLLDTFMQEKYDSISIVYQVFKSAISQKVHVESFLPLDLEAHSPQENKNSSLFSKDLIFEVSPTKLVEILIQKYFSTQIYRAMCESLASEHGARMCSMENATKNAEEIEKQLQLQFNKIRQSSITTELIEVTSGVEAMSV